jgi:hypothetical protein
MEGMPAGTEIVTDWEATHDPNPWRCYRRCLSDPPEAVTHVVIVQDDAIVCRNFGEAVELVTAARPDDILSLFVGGVSRKTAQDMRAAAARGRHWSPLFFRDVSHVVALVWPVKLAAEFLEWAKEARLPGYRGVCRSDDAVVGEWLRRTRRVAWATVPCLVEHPDDVPTLIRQRERARDGLDRGRCAVTWIGDGDPSELDWTV